MNAIAFPGLLRDWRKRRRLSQLDLALDADISQRHLSFLETGRSTPSREMVLHLAEQLSMPLRERNTLLLAAGFAPAFPLRTIDDPDLGAVRRAVEMILSGHEPHPALAVDRHWNLVASNRAMAPLLAGASPELLNAPLNVLRLSLHPDGLAGRILNFREWRAHLIARLSDQIEITGDPALIALLDELKAYPVPPGARPHLPGTGETLGGIAVPLEFASDAGVLRFISTTTVFGTAVDVILSELAIESFFPATAETAEILRRLGDTGAR